MKTFAFAVILVCLSICYSQADQDDFPEEGETESNSVINGHDMKEESGLDGFENNLDWESDMGMPRSNICSNKHNKNKKRRKRRKGGKRRNRQRRRNSRLTTTTIPPILTTVPYNITIDSNQECGVKPTDQNIESRSDVSFIVGGNAADVNEWPWMVKINFFLRDKFIDLCGGTIINKRTILSAAHCVPLPLPSNYSIEVGRHYASGSSEIIQRLEIAQLKNHENFVQSNLDNDIAILITTEDIIFNDEVSPVCLPPPNIPNGVLVNKYVYTKGWGHTKFEGQTSSVLLEVKLRVIDTNQCLQSYKQADYEFADESELICAGTTEGGMDACQGDSGGPLVIETQNNRWMVIGVVSQGKGCGEAKYPGIYTRVSKYIPWIEDNMYVDV